MYQYNFLFVFLSACVNIFFVQHVSIIYLRFKYNFILLAIYMILYSRKKINSSIKKKLKYIFGPSKYVEFGFWSLVNFCFEIHPCKSVFVF